MPDLFAVYSSNHERGIVIELQEPYRSLACTAVSNGVSFAPTVACGRDRRLREAFKNIEL
jgi:hypothetical protein